MISRTYSAAAISLLMASNGCNGFVTPHPSRVHSTTPRSSSTPSSSMKMNIDGIDDTISLLSTPMLLSSAVSSLSIPSNIFSATSQLVASDPQLEAELLTDVSHVALDFTTFISPNTSWLRFWNVMGRILLISSDYIQDNYISPDEEFFQASMLFISMNLFVRSVWPKIVAAASNTTLSVRDRRAFTLLFDEVGLSALQFKTLLTSSTLEWVELSSNDEVELNGDYLYWMYSGDVSTFSSSDKIIGNGDESTISNRIFGEVPFAKALEVFISSKDRHKKKGKSEKATPEDGAADTDVHETLTAGAGGSILLRMSTPKLLELMDNDDQLATSINRLVLLCMQQKLSRTFHKDEWKKTYHEPKPSATGSSNTTTVLQSRGYYNASE
ncbi:predicted protein [Thalassiosira pseudonana CCMP1335]|uniref:Uncharacterized protein n=1 Tax=Thalassiosira pseudonana TaxID=35128 RepID=B8BX90_THAPS|nr:predicted protein [Thalassiosira pseudonana CCMP1335]EED93666.1 predicted protein [Thalassiosira pseudonana CCMP1335]